MRRFVPETIFSRQPDNELPRRRLIEGIGDRYSGPQERVVTYRDPDEQQEDDDGRDP